jgi:hypothetical protein
VTADPQLDAGCRPDKTPPGKLQRLAIQFGEIPTPESADPHDHPARRPQPEIGPVKIAQFTGKLHPSRHETHSVHRQSGQFLGAGRFQPRCGYGKQFEPRVSHFASMFIQPALLIARGGGSRQ